jgi:hypothetical protein
MCIGTDCGQYSCEQNWLWPAYSMCIGTDCGQYSCEQNWLWPACSALIGTDVPVTVQAVTYGVVLRHVRVTFLP